MDWRGEGREGERIAWRDARRSSDRGHIEPRVKMGIPIFTPILNRPTRTFSKRVSILPTFALRPPLPPLLQSPRRRARSLARTARLRSIVFRCDFALGIPSARQQANLAFPCATSASRLFSLVSLPALPFFPARSCARLGRVEAHRTLFFFSAAAFEAHFRLFFPPSSSRVLVGSSPALSTLMVNVCENHDSTLATLVST